MRTLSTIVTTLVFLGACSQDVEQPTADNTDKSCCSSDLAAAPLPSTSLYQLESKWVDQNNKARTLTDFRGRPWLVAMIFTNCSYACPQLLSDIKAIDNGLSPSEQSQLRVLLVSMDDERDTPEILSAYAETNDLDERWTLLHGSAGDVRELAAVLGVNYIKQPTGDYSHSNIISLLDRDGIVVHRQEGLAASPELTRSKWLVEAARSQ